MQKALLHALVLSCGLAWSFGCARQKTVSLPPEKAPQAALLKVTTTVGMITDAVEKVGGNRVEVMGLMGPSVDPHLYKASHGDIAKLTRADLIFYNGLHLEGKMGEVFRQMARKKKVIPVAEAVPPEKLLGPKRFEGAHDPHVWMDVNLWMYAVQAIRDGLMEADPEGREVYESNTEAYLEELQELDEYVRQRAASVPQERRVLVTAHDAFNYFGRAYDVEVKALQGISTASEYGLADVERLVDLLVSRKIKAVFVESSVPQRSIEAVVEGCRAKGHEVSIGGELYSDAMGPPGTEEGTYRGMIRHNIDTIVEALQ